MSCQNCGSDSINPCSCSNGYNAFTVSTANVSISDPMTIPVSNTGQYIGVWARVGQPIFIQGYGTYRVTASTATSISVAFPAGTYIGGLNYVPGTTDYANAGTIISGAKISPGGEKGDTGISGLITNLIDAFHGEVTTTSQFPVFAFLRSVPIVGGTLAVAGDSLRIYSKWFVEVNIDTDSGIPQISFGGTILTTALITRLFNLYEVGNIEIIITYVSDLLIDVRFTMSTQSKGLGSYANNSSIWATTPLITTYEMLAVPVLSMAANQVVLFEGAVIDSVNDEIKLGFDTIEILKKI